MKLFETFRVARLILTPVEFNRFRRLFENNLPWGYMGDAARCAFNAVIAERR